MAKASEWLLLFLANALWQSSLVVAAGVAADRLLRRFAARYRHRLWVAALTFAIALPASVPLRLALNKPPSRLTNSAAMSQSGEDRLTFASGDFAGGGHSAAARDGRDHFDLPLRVARRTTFAIVAVYMLLLFWRLTALLAGWRLTQRILRKACEPELSAAAGNLLERCRCVLHVKKVWLLSAPVAVPITVGALRPALIMPERVLDQPPELLLTAFGHEMAHVKRADYFFNLLYELVSFPLWFHPALRFALRHIRQTRELCCDEIVTERLLEPRAYAQSLVELAGAALPFGRPAPTFTVGIADADILEERIMTILKTRVQAASWPLALAALFFVIPCFAAAPFALQVSVTQTEPLAIQQAKAVEEPQQPYDATITVQTADGPVTFTSVHELRIGDVVKTNGRALRITGKDADGQYHAVAFRRGRALSADELASNDVESVESLQVSGAVSEGVNGGVGSGVNGGVQGGVPQEGTQQQFRIMSDEGRKDLIIQEREMTPEERVARQKLEHDKLVVHARHQAELAQAAKITMQDAIQIAQNNTAGAVTEARLVGEPGRPAYLVSIVPQANPAADADAQKQTMDNVPSHLLINAIDGSVMALKERPLPPPSAPPEKQ